MGIHIPDLYKRLRLIGDIDAIIADTADLIAAHRLDLDTVRDVLAQDMFGGEIGSWLQEEKWLTTDALFDKGMPIRREVLGPEYVDASMARADEFMMSFQRATTAWAWGWAWATRPWTARRAA